MHPRHRTQAVVVDRVLTAAMQRAVAISALGLGSTSPNPLVGCVILDQDGTPVGEGYHRRKGEAHAEVNALAAAGSKAAGGRPGCAADSQPGQAPPDRAPWVYG
jgi:diaminohydroxyphosphoribosylaminopyrimidine deaminase / 5-amino-6-(5-phosphoribosylamino)uracil reductase